MSEHLDVRVREVRPNFRKMSGFVIRTQPELHPEPEPHRSQWGPELLGTKKAVKDTQRDNIPQ